VRTVWEVFDPDRVPVGAIEQVTGVLLPRYNDIGTWSYTVAARSIPSEVRAVINEPGSGIRVTNADYPDGEPIIAGPMTKPAESWGEDAPWDGQLVVAGVSWEQHLADRVTYGSPSSAWTAQTPGTLYRRPAGSGTAAAETVARAFINVNAGPGALVARRVAGLALEADGARGALLAKASANEPLLEVVQHICAVGGLRFQVLHQPDGSLLLRFTVPATRSDVLLSVDSGAVRSGTHSVAAPTCSRALISSEVSLVEMSDASRETLWRRRIERVLDQGSTSDPDEITEAGDEVLLDGRATAMLAATVVDTDDASYGVDYLLGDVVPYEQRVLDQGVIATDTIREVKITVAADGVRIEPVIGAEGATGSPGPYRRIRSVGKLVRQVSRPW